MHAATNALTKVICVVVNEGWSLPFSSTVTVVGWTEGVETICDEIWLFPSSGVDDGWAEKANSIKDSLDLLPVDGWVKVEEWDGTH